MELALNIRMGATIMPSQYWITHHIEVEALIEKYSKNPVWEIRIKRMSALLKNEEGKNG